MVQNYKWAKRYKKVEKSGKKQRILGKEAGRRKRKGSSRTGRKEKEAESIESSLSRPIPSQMTIKAYPIKKFPRTKPNL